MDLNTWYELAIQEMVALNEGAADILEDAEALLVPADDAEENGD